MIEKLLTLHNKSLGVKNIWTKQELINIIRIDFEKILYALFELKTKSIPQLLTDFFSENKKIVPNILAKLEGKSLSHIGFEINEPLAIVLYGFNHVLNKFNQTFGTQFKIIKVFRFPASLAFQHRVNAFVEVLRIWIQLNNREVMLELFDIHHKIDTFLLGNQFKIKKRGIINNSYANESFLINHSNAITPIITRDEIWHYAIDVDNSNEVTQLHNYFKRLVEQNDIYKLPFESIVKNNNDGSFYTKIINQKKRMEMEFVTQLN
jgi:hypothetical protein